MKRSIQPSAGHQPPRKKRRNSRGTPNRIHPRTAACRTTCLLSTRRASPATSGALSGFREARPFLAYIETKVTEY